MQTTCCKLLYLSTHRRPDIGFAAATLSHSVPNCWILYWKYGNRTLRYLVGTLGLRIKVGQDSPSATASITGGYNPFGYSNRD